MNICNPRQSKYLRNVLKLHFKTSLIDSLVLAKGAELDLLRGELYEKRYAQLKELLQLHKKLKRDLTSLKNQTTRLMDVTFPERSKAIRGLFGKTSLEVLQCTPIPSDLLDLGVTCSKEPAKFCNVPIILTYSQICTYYEEHRQKEVVYENDHLRNLFSL